MRLRTTFITSLIFVACSSKAPAPQPEQNTKSDTLSTVVPDERGYLVKVGDMAPDFTMELTNGEKITLSSYKGKVVMLQFTASWCGVCRKEMPFIEKDIWLKNKDNENFVLLAIDRDEPLQTVKDFAESTGITYPIGLDPNADIFAKYADRKAGITRNVIIGTDGKIGMLTRLYDESEFASMVRKIDELLNQQK